VVVAAAGNDGDRTINYPAAYANVMSVAATTSIDSRATFSNFGGTIDIAAPGKGILSTYLGTDPESAYRFLDGTSMAAPHVSALAALLVAQDKAEPPATQGNRSNTEIRNLIQRSSRDIGTAGRDKYFGWGRIEANKALRRGAQNP
jgi:subtilisin family serine protease